jgi:uncharacterized protein with FMN-binding domain
MLQSSYNITHMKKVTLSAIVVVLFGVYVFFLKSGQGQTNYLASGSATGNSLAADVATQTSPTQNTSTVSTSPTAAPKPTPVKTPSTTPTPTPAPVPAPKPKPVVTQSGWKDGTYTGQGVDVYFGVVQVSATISGGRLTDIGFLSYPSDNRTSYGKSSMALPILKQEAISSQSYRVNSVSGASETSLGFMQSLASALSQA